MSKWLVTGGAGYIGAHVVRNLISQGFQTVVVDDLSSGLERKIPKDVPFYKFDISDTLKLTEILKENKIVGVIHLAAKKAVGESMLNPSFYYQENIGGLLSVLQAMANAEVKNIVYSSSASVYGTPKEEKVSELSETHPESPYGETKLVGEWLLKADQAARNINWIALRYFNVVGASENELGDTGVNNLVPMIFRAIAKNQRPQVFGGDYQTPDGSCIRDYIHVSDLAEAHAVAAKKLLPKNYSGIFNIGRGSGISVKEVMKTVADVIGRELNYEIVERRAGDPAQTIADISKASKELEWEAKLDLTDMVKSAWDAWQTFPPNNL